MYQPEPDLTLDALTRFGRHLGMCFQIVDDVLDLSSTDDALGKLASRPGVLLLFTDIVMPGKDGRKLADEALRLRPKLKLLFTTGFTRNAVVHNGVLDHGVNLIAKPFTLDQLGAKLREVLDA